MPTKTFTVAQGAVEDVSKRTRDAKHFANPDGTNTAVFGRNLHYPGPSGWEDVDLTYRASGAEFVADKHYLKYRLYRRLAASRLAVTEQTSGKGIEFTLPGSPTPSGSRVGFAKDGLNWEYATRKSGLKLSATVPARQGPKTYSFVYVLQGGAAPLSVDTEGNLVSDVFTMPRAYVKGADKVIYPCETWAVSGATASFSWDDSTLPDAAFPYELDPTTTFAVGASGDDQVVFKLGTSYPPGGAVNRNSTDTQFDASRRLEGGNYFISNALARWNTSSIPDTATVDSAVIRGFVTGRSNDNARNVTIERYAWNNTDTDYAETASSGAGSKALSTITVNADNDFAISSPNTNISKTGVSAFRLHVDGGVPTGLNRIDIASFDHTTLAEPRLIVTYTEDTTPPAARTDLSATPGFGEIVLGWTANTEADFSHYNIYRGTAPGGPYTKLNTANVTTNSYRDTGLSTTPRHYYVVRGVDTTGNESANSNEANAQANGSVSAPRISSTPRVFTPAVTQPFDISRLRPDAILAVTNLAGEVTNIQDDPDAADANWLTAVDKTANTDLRVSTENPPKNLAPAETQEIRLRVRRVGGTGTPTTVVELRENGVLRKTLVPSTGITSDVVLAGTFKASDLSSLSGEGVEVRVVTSAAGGGPSVRATVEVGAIEWNAFHDRVAQVISPPRVGSPPRIFGPTVLPGEVFVSPPRVTSAPRVIEPAFVGARDLNQIIVPIVRRAPRVFSPSITTGPVTVSPPRVEGRRIVFGAVVTLETVVRERRQFVIRRVLEGYAGPIRMESRLFLSDAMGSELAPLPGWESADVTMSNYADATWALDLEIRYTDTFDPLRDHILAAIDLYVDGRPERFYMGLYRFMVPSYTYLEHLRTWNLTGRSLEEVLRHDMPPQGHTVAAGTGALSAARVILEEGGIPASMIRFPIADRILQNGLYFDPLDDSDSASRLRMVNEVLNAAGYQALKADRYGRFYTRDIDEDSKRAANVFYGPRDVSDAENFIGDEVSDDWDDERFANRIIVESDDVNQDPPLVAVAENRNPNSRGSFDQMGRWITKRVSLKTITSQADADRMARAQLEAASGFYRRATINTLRDPRREPDETYEIAVNSEGTRVMDGRWRVINWSLSMGAGLEPMSHEIAQVTKI